jgi:ribosomal protein L5
MYNINKYIKYVVNAHLLEKLYLLLGGNKMVNSEKIILNFNVSSDVVKDNPFSFMVHYMFLELITSQKLAISKTDKNINDFNLRKNMKIGAFATLRNDNMYLFLLKLIIVSNKEIYNFKGFYNDLDYYKFNNLEFGLNNLDSFESVFLTYENWAFLEDRLRYGVNIHLVNNIKNNIINLLFFSHLGIKFLN